MLINIKELIQIFNININGILHIGGHNCEELQDYIQANIEAQSQGAIHRLDVPKTRVINSENGKAQKEIINPEYRINEQKSSPKRALIVILTFITSTFSFIYYLLIRRKFAQ